MLQDDVLHETLHRVSEAGEEGGRGRCNLTWDTLAYKWLRAVAHGQFTGVHTDR